MTDDIVTRLQNECQCSDDCKAENDPCIPMQAADEIERLRADVKRWRNWAEEFFYTDPDCECPLCDQVREAIGKTI